MDIRRRRGVAALGLASMLLGAACGGGSEPGAGGPSGAPAGGEGQQNGSAAPGPTIKVGGLWALTGISQSFGKNSQAVLKMAIDEINGEGGVELADGTKQKLEAVFYDEGCPQAETGIAAARKAAADPVLVVIGPTCSTTAEPVFGLLEKNFDDPGDSGLQLPIFTDTAIKAGLASISPWAFRNVPSEVEMYKGLFAWLKATNPELKTVAFGTEVDFAHSKATTEGSMKPGAAAAELKTVADEGWKLSDTDFSTQVSKIRSAKPDVVAVSAHPFSACGFLKELKRQGVKPKRLVGLTSSLTEETLEGCGAEAEGMIGPTSFAPVNPVAKAAATKVAKEYKGFLDLHSAPVLENMRLLKTLFKSAGVEGKPETVGSDRIKLAKALGEVQEFEGLLGKIKFHHEPPFGGEVEKAWVVVQAKGDGFDVVYLPEQFKGVANVEE